MRHWRREKDEENMIINSEVRQLCYSCVAMDATHICLHTTATHYTHGHTKNLLLPVVGHDVVEVGIILDVVLLGHWHATHIPSIKAIDFIDVICIHLHHCHIGVEMGALSLEKYKATNIKN